MSSEISLTIGHVLRHAPAKSGQGLEAALIDIAQDLLLRDLHVQGVLDALAFKGGTALRKLYAGAAGRFSTDLDFSLRNLDDDPSAVVELLVGSVDRREIGPFRFGIAFRRGKPHMTIQSTLGPSGPLVCKLDVNPATWMHTELKPCVSMPIHERYGGPLPRLHAMQIEENIAEKVSRLNRATPSRDVFDLVWIMQNRGASGAISILI